MLTKIKKKIPSSIKRPLRKTISYAHYKPYYSKLTKEKFQNNSKSRIILLGSPDSANLGDHAIAEAEKKFIEEQFPNASYLEFSLRHFKYELNSIKGNITNSDIILIHGGGFLGNLWIEAEEMVRTIIKEFPNNKIIVMPQTIFFDERFNKEEELEKSKEIYIQHKNITFFLREKQSYDFMKDNFDSSIDIKLVPDIVTYLEIPNKNTRKNEVLYCFRTDKEKVNHSKVVNKVTKIIQDKHINIDHTDTVLEKEVTEEDRLKHLYDKFNQFQSYDLVITDRLHGMVFSLITGTPCIALNNASGKVLNVYEWIKEVPYIKCIDNPSKGELSALIEELLALDEMHYNNKLVTENFKPLIEEISENLA